MPFIPPGAKIFSKGDKIKKSMLDLLVHNKSLVENHDLRWRDFGSKYRGKIKRDGSALIRLMNEYSGSLQGNNYKDNPSLEE